MKDFDFVSFTLWFALLLLAAFVGGDLYLRYELKEKDRQLAACEKELGNIGEYCAKISALDQRIRDDKMVQESASPYLFFQKRSAESGYAYESINEDKQKPQPGYQDTKWMLDAKNQKFPRRTLVQMMQLVEKSSQRVRTVGAELRLDPTEAKEDRWKAKFTFLLREPIVTSAQ